MSTRTILAFALVAAGIIAALLLYKPKTADAPPQTAEIASSREVEPPAREPQPMAADDREENASVVELPTAMTQNAIRGVVENELGEPVPQAEVSAYYADTGAARTTSDQNGQFVVPNLDPAQRYRVSAVAEGYAEAFVDGVAPDAPLLKLVLPPNGIVRGRVIDAQSGNALPQFEVAYLKVVPETTEELALYSVAELVTWTKVDNPRGEFEIASIRPGEPVTIAARALGHAVGSATTAQLEPGETREGVVIQLEAATAIAGIVVTPDGKPAPSAQVFVGTSERTLVEAGFTDTDGEFSIARVPDGDLVLRAKYRGYVDAFANVSAIKGLRNEVRLELLAGGAIEGVVSDGGRPVIEQLVVASTRNQTAPHSKPFETNTNAQGRFHFSGLPSGEVEISTTRRDEHGEIDQRSIAAIVEPNKVTVVNFELGLAAASVVVHATMNGEPIGNGEVKGVIGTDAGERRFSGSLEPDGSYRAERLPAGVALLEVIVHGESNTIMKQTFSHTLGDGEEWQVAASFDSQSSISGKVEGLGEGETAEVWAIPGNIDASTSKVEDLIALRESAAVTVTTIEGGAFLIETIQPGEYTVLALAFNPDDDAGDPIDSLRIARQTITVAEGAVQEITLRP
ncbi:MAG TPA: carboxypeptidase-like regulatory domain-containing protein [Candidatus Hydrogenedentes bacterium]|nr:carboxypeptidase-like regulatory domain-containing protein [Candidatus Hydrogenedentota bacterium]